MGVVVVVMVISNVFMLVGFVVGFEGIDEEWRIVF